MRDSGLFIIVYSYKIYFYLKAGIKAATYSASFSENQRAKVQNDWMNNEINVICATSAFGKCI